MALMQSLKDLELKRQVSHTFLAIVNCPESGEKNVTII
jgi:hypothetical protein